MAVDRLVDTQDLANAAAGLSNKQAKNTTAPWLTYVSTFPTRRY